MPDTPSPDQTPKQRLALAVRYDGTSAPKVVAKGKGALAEKIISTAKENGVLVEENPYLAEALSHVELDAEIPIELYRAVAEIISYVLKTRSRMEKAG
ncbi:MAG: EscU/YscU/HrcU family type III secretion system export apparatus switch protein [Ancalomicrobiaceae bacterium]|nr:EscU/YscU/HrcU family type III secretion system export apparatus switch protein [Ancalomicrobiaceae bacterium]